MLGQEPYIITVFNPSDAGRRLTSIEQRKALLGEEATPRYKMQENSHLKGPCQEVTEWNTNDLLLPWDT